MEFLWQSTKKDATFNEGTLFTGVNEHGYNPPDGFCYDWVCAGDDPIMDDPRLNGYNVDDVVRRFKIAAEHQRKHFKGNNIMMTMGSDFQVFKQNFHFRSYYNINTYVRFFE